MSGKDKQNLKILIGLIVLLFANLACASGPKTWCEYWDGGDWIVERGQDPLDGCCKTDSTETVANKCKSNNVPSSQLPDLEPDSDPDDNPAQEESLPDSAGFDPASCLPQPGSYKLEVQNLNDRTSSNGKHVCGADGMLTNTGKQPLVYAIFRINNYGAEETKYPDGKWLGTGYRVVEPGQTDEYGSFYRCIGPGCDGGEWYHIQRISILYHTPGCTEYAATFEDKPPESIIEIENPCSW